MVSFWLASAAYQGETTPNSFVARWNNLTLYQQTNLPALGWTNMQYLVTATTKSSTIEFDFGNVPAAFGLDDVRVETLQAPLIQSASVKEASVALTWSSLATLSYQLQTTTNLAGPNWVNTGQPVTATSGSASGTAAATAGATQFYRVVILPAQ
jgi:hypothetical protein